MGSDRILSWFVKNVLIPNAVDYNTPGFVQERISFRSKAGMPLRNVLASETAFANIEESLVERFGEEANDVLYSAGKLFGKRYCMLEAVPSRESKQRDIMWTAFLRTFETVFSTKIEDKICWDKKKLEIHSTDSVICRKSGIGSLWMEGAIAGFWGGICEDPTIEGVQYECQGRGDPVCMSVYAPAKELSKRFKSFHTSKEKPKPVPKAYQKMNASLSIPSEASANLKQMIDFNEMSYIGGVLQVDGERFFPFELSLVHIMELKVGERFGSKGINVIRSSARAAGKKIANKPHRVLKLMSALGWGIPQETGKGVYFHGFPWSEYFNGRSVFFEGFLEGALSKKLSFKYDYSLGYLGVNVGGL
ncbi:MAG: hypothetical protein JW834_01080 [Candidatus Diapherotrites archaeon]|nr:hypothetical protein [Candidatus Diapherotrites archaeon]